MSFVTKTEDGLPPGLGSVVGPPRVSSVSAANKMQILKRQLRSMSAKKIHPGEKDVVTVQESKSQTFQIKQHTSKSATHVSRVFSGKVCGLGTLATKSPLDQELAIQNSRVLNIMDRAIEKMEIIVYLPTLLQNNGCILKRFFNKDEAQFIMYTCAPYTGIITERDFDYYKIAQIENKIVKIQGNTKQSVTSQRGISTTSSDRIAFTTHESFSNRRTIDNGKPGNASIEKVDPMMSKAVEILFSNDQLRDAIAKGRLVLRDDVAKTYIHCWKVLREGSVKRLSISAKEEAARDNMLRKLYRSNKECVAKIEQITQTLQKQKEFLGKELRARYTVIENYNSNIEKMRSKFKEDLKKKIAISEKTMAEATVASEARQAEMRETIKSMKEQFEQVLRDNLMDEKILRKKKYKIESQLASWLAKYDNDVGERQAEYEEISQLYEEELREMTDLQEKFDSQEEEYMALMAEKEEEERQYWDEMAREFLRIHSARIIQRAWKAYKARKHARKMAKKNKKKAKAMRAGAVHVPKVKHVTPPPPVPPPPAAQPEPEPQPETAKEAEPDAHAEAEATEEQPVED